MKKIISAITAVTLSMSCVLTGVRAAGRTEEINKALESDEIHILYNDNVVEYEDVKPVNTDGRVMIPFRAALESMGVSVEYDETERKVTAKKGDITITFTLMDDTIYIDNNGEKSTITLDVPMIIVDDRTLVPIRFMSNALGMQVGWDGDSETVVIVDAEDYLKELAEKAPQVYKLLQLSDADSYNKISFNFDMETSIMGKTLKTTNFNADAAISGNALTADISMNNVGQKVLFDGDGQFTEGGITASESTHFSVITEDKTVYIKTDAFEQYDRLADSDAEAAIRLDGDTWYSIDLEALTEKLGDDNIISKLIDMVFLLSGNEDFEELLKMKTSPDKEAVYDDVLQYAYVMDAMENIDKYIVITETDSGYIVDIDISPDEGLSIINDEINLILKQDLIPDSTPVSFGLKIEKDGTTQSLSAKLDLGWSLWSLIINAEGKAELETDIHVQPVPEESVDITDLISSELINKQQK